MNLKSSLVRFLYPTNSIRRVIWGLNKGARFIVRPGMGATYALGLDHLNLQFLNAHMHSGMTVYDIGANCGQMTLFFSQKVGKGGSVLSFEPVPDNVSCLQKNVALNDHRNVKVFSAAVSADNEPKHFCYDMAHHTMGTLEESMITPGTWEETIEVSCLALDTLISDGERAPQLIKIDVEGAGLEVIKGALQLIQIHRPAIYFEIHAAHDQAPELQAISMLKEKFGYLISGIDSILQDPPTAMWGGALWCDPGK